MRLEKEIATVLESQNYTLNNIICDTLKKFKLATLCNQVGIVKEAGISPVDIITLLLALPLMALKNVHQLYKSKYVNQAAMQKDTIYRLKNNERYSWRSLLYAVAKKYKGLTKSEESTNGKTTAFIIDDTTDQRTGYKIENISYVFDHILKKTIFGFKILLLAFNDGTTTTPLDFTVHTEKKLEHKKAKKQYKKDVSPKSHGGKRRKEAQTPKPAQAIAMIKRAVKHGYIAQYVLCDAWFTSRELIKEIRAIKNGGMHVIAGIRNGTQKYLFGDSRINAKELIALLKKEGTERRNRSLNIRYFEAVVEYADIGKVKLFMCRYPGQKQWRVFISTDTTLSMTETMKIYGIRWSIEVLFREAKQYLQLGACQSQDFDAQIASITITFMLYTFLTYLKRRNSYETLGELHRLINQDIIEKTLAERLWILFEELLQFIIDEISLNGSMDILLLRKTKEFQYIKEVFESSFLFDQFDSVKKAS